MYGYELIWHGSGEANRLYLRAADRLASGRIAGLFAAGWA